MENTIKLQTDSILHVPLQSFDKDFTFIVNGERFETNSIVANLLSPTISKQRRIDPTLHEYSINTKERGDFQNILNLLNFKTNSFTQSDTSFIIEVIDQLGTEKVDIKLTNEDEELSRDNVFDKLKEHQKHQTFYNERIQQEIAFITTNFSEMKEKLIEFIESNDVEYSEFNDYLIESIIGNSKLQLENEDELLQMINSMYVKNRHYSQLYKYVDFINVEISSINEFVDIFDFNDLTKDVWLTIVDRFQHKILNDETTTSKHKIKVKGIKFESKGNEFDGIFKYFQTNCNIDDELNITASSKECDMKDVLKFDDLSAFFQTNNKPNQWICFEFKKHQIIPSNYIIRTINSENNYHLKSWILEGSNDNSNWFTIDEHKNDSSLRGKSRVQLFSITKNHNKKSFKYLRIRQTGPNWNNNNDSDNHLLIGVIEFYGNLI